MFLFSVSVCSCSAAESQDIVKTTRANPETPISCGTDGAWLQVLGSGGPEINDKRASSAYLIWLNGESRILVDAGSGAAYNFEQAGGDFSTIDTILLTHLHVDHSADLPAFIKGSYFIQRSNHLPIVGPDGNSTMPATDEYIQRLFNETSGAYKYLGDYLEDSDKQSDYKVSAIVYQSAFKTKDNKINISATPVTHGPIPALAWRLDIGNKSIVFSGDMGRGDESFINLLKNTDYFVAHNAIPQSATGFVRNLHMAPDRIGEYAKAGNVKNLIISHRMNRTLGKEVQTLEEINKTYTGPVSFANDLDCFELK